MTVIGHGAFLVAASGTSGAAHTGRQARTGARSISRGERDAHGALPKRLHAVRPVDRHIARSLTAGLCRWLADEFRAGRIGLINAWVVAHSLAERLSNAEIPSSLIMASRSDAPAVGRVGLDVLTRTPT